MNNKTDSVWPVVGKVHRGGLKLKMKPAGLQSGHRHNGVPKWITVS